MDLSLRLATTCTCGWHEHEVNEQTIDAVPIPKTGCCSKLWLNEEISNGNAATYHHIMPLHFGFIIC